MLLFAVSAGVAVLVFGWPLATVFMCAVAFHELGHIWAMRRLGLTVLGIWFIPGLGAVAAARGSLTRWKMSFVASMGPLAGFVTMPLCQAQAYALTRDPKVAEQALVLVFCINMFNLLPVPPFDGGNITASPFASFSRWLGPAIAGSVSVILVYAGLRTGQAGIWLSGIVGIVVAAIHYRRPHPVLAMTKRHAAGWLAAYAGIIVLGIALAVACTAVQWHFTGQP